jgi:hypothetical protein
VVIESDQPISAIANTLGDGDQYGASSNGFTGGATTINLPLLMKGNAGFDTWFNVQNTGSADATVTVTYNPGAIPDPQNGVVIKPGAAKTFNQADVAALAAGFVGSAVVTSTQPVVATVMQVGTGGTKSLLAYNSFTTGSTTVKLPLVQANNFGFFTGIQAMNTGTLPTDITITYGPNTVAGGATPAAESCTAVQPGQSCTKIQLNGQWSFQYVGAANITNSAAQPLVAITNQLTLAGKGSAYEGFNPTAATLTAVAPLVMANNFGYFTGVQVQNVGTGNCDFTVKYSPNTVSSAIGTPINETATAVAPGASFTFLQLGGQWTDRYVGGANVTGTGAGCLVAAIVNELNNGAAGDLLFTYNATNK